MCVTWFGFDDVQCSLIGALLIIGGLYCVLWGKKTDNLVERGPSDQIEKGSRDNDHTMDIRVNNGVLYDEEECKSQI